MLFHHMRRYIAAAFQSIQDGVTLTLTEMPNVAKYRGKLLMQIITIARAGYREA
jgi:hypothetical protein